MRVFITRVDIVVTQAGILHDKETVGAWLERSEAYSACLRLVKATGLHSRIN